MIEARKRTSRCSVRFPSPVPSSPSSSPFPFSLAQVPFPSLCLLVTSLPSLPVSPRPRSLPSPPLASSSPPVPSLFLSPSSLPSPIRSPRPFAFFPCWLGCPSAKGPLIVSPISLLACRAGFRAIGVWFDQVVSSPTPSPLGRLQPDVAMADAQPDVAMNAVPDAQPRPAKTPHQAAEL